MTVKNVKALLVDDEASSDYIQGVIKCARPLGLEISTVEPMRIVSAVSKDDPEVLIIDAKMKTSPRQIARMAVKANPELAVFFWTGYTSDADFKDLGTSLNPLIRCDVGVKAVRADSSPEILQEALVAPVHALVERPLADCARPVLEFGEAQARIFHMPVDEFNRQSISDARDLIAEGHQEASWVIESIFGYSSAEWLLVAGPNMDVIRWGSALANMPDSRRIFELGHRFRYIPLLFTRPMEVDEVEAPVASRSWAECPPADYYPCFGIDFGGDSTGTQQIHFDTGAVKTLLSLERLMLTGVLGEFTPIDIRRSQRGGQTFDYLDREVRILLSDGVEAASVNVRAAVVFDWDRCPFARLCHHGNCPGSRHEPHSRKWICGRREVGLLGRDILIAGGLRIVLDGAKQKTRFLRPGDERTSARKPPWR